MCTQAPDRRARSEALDQVLREQNLVRLETGREVVVRPQGNTAVRCVLDISRRVAVDTQELREIYLLEAALQPF